MIDFAIIIFKMMLINHLVPNNHRQDKIHSLVLKQILHVQIFK